MGVLKARLVLEAVADQAVQADMGEPDEGQPEQEMAFKGEGEERQGSAEVWKRL